MMPADARRIRRGSRVRLHMAIYLEDGTEALSTFGEEPLELAIGDGTLTAPMEGLLLGLSAGDRERILADGGELFGALTEERLHWLPREDFPGEVPERGMLVAFDTPGGAETPGLIKDIRDDQVLVDFNHPLSGRALRIEVEVLEVDNGPAH